MFIEFVSPNTGEKLISQNGHLVSPGGESFEIVNEIPRFTPSDNYASAFGLQWNTFTRTQLDSETGLDHSLVRIERCLGDKIETLRNKTILELGCGAGRFTEHLVGSGAIVHAVDLSNAVEANKKNIGNASNYVVAQASVYNLPFPDNSFDIVFCLGVIQHTPSPEKTIEALWKKVKPGGILMIDHYKWRLSYYFNLKPLWRHVLKSMKASKSQKIVNSVVKFFFPLHWKTRNIKPLWWLLHRISPLIEYTREYPQLDYGTHYQLSRLDTYDSLTDYYKHLRSKSQIQNILRKLGAENIWLNEDGNGIEARAIKNI
ncbi:MAG: class I SAM-dependent methyltransferase [Bacteroidetes bacterium]|nr:MAG: class I SAM-dependent methyltransferase [Bacteroidota bacterium]REJ99694.1 MAG: class I SAM-dependent methyltransferase [Bacteroidota bacterium]REK33927.1 MAG: class I SAM-dependent methyltransferase [Bacteroidota bacterium]REK47693.1 MAG: class I SAM-dependent methyltransferase [Bacteroidota bacterium]